MKAGAFRIALRTRGTQRGETIIQLRKIKMKIVSRIVFLVLSFCISGETYAQVNTQINSEIEEVISQDTNTVITVSDSFIITEMENSYFRDPYGFNGEN